MFSQNSMLDNILGKIWFWVYFNLMHVLGDDTFLAIIRIKYFTISSVNLGNCSKNICFLMPKWITFITCSARSTFMAYLYGMIKKIEISSFLLSLEPIILVSFDISYLHIVLKKCSAQQLLSGVFLLKSHILIRFLLKAKWVYISPRRNLKRVTTATPDRI